ncbi:hypothetical protein KFK09_024431 [Dendrobium nobile]|uniref:Uncharacterized protein n=1 Tax=Dendrobium nobile TaxID=94219 RepID=A0A8T3ADR5_DENNO|nr:hypothetical protein KFK09_024431 [Dendrobium nobile]
MASACSSTTGMRKQHEIQFILFSYLIPFIYLNLCNLYFFFSKKRERVIEIITIGLHFISELYYSLDALHNWKPQVIRVLFTVDAFKKKAHSFG